LILVLNVNLSKRLAILVENAQRLPRKQQLNAPLSGADELSFLDGSLHQASVELYKAAEFRTSLMQMVAHDLRSPLFSCLIALEVILDSENENLTPKGQRQVEAMQRNLDRLIGLTNDLLLIEQYENDQLKLDLNPENIQEMVDQALTAVEALAKSKTVTLRNLAAREYVNVDRNRILQVLVNYLSNAIKFSPPDSIVEVSSDIQATKVRLVVRDHGKGLSVSDKNKLFQKFFQTADGKTAGGAGLGLAICKSIVKAHGGEVGVSSEVGRGASFWFSIPVERV
jgi:signal transduction histidine kinase